MIYTTGDASGQNMTTTCTAHAMTWVRNKFQADHNVDPLQYVIEGNSASDKKLSHYSIQQGRGIHIIAECELKDQDVERVLRIKSTDMLRALRASQTMSRMDGMVGYNINVTNALAGIFVATGQDLACIHESGVGILNMEKTEDGLYCALHLPALVVGTVGGGTQLLRQREALGIMDCAGTGKVERFAKLIAGFALSLELSTFAAIVGGQFAKVHERMGRNKPVNWLVKGEINQSFLEENLKAEYKKQVKGFSFLDKELVDNGLIINLTKKVNNKITGFVPLELSFENHKESVLLKSKPLDKEVMQGLHYMAASIDPSLADLLLKYQDNLEFKNCHLKELKLYELLDKNKLEIMPRFYGAKTEPQREIYTCLMELLSPDDFSHFNSENQPELWKPEDIKSVIRSIDEVHHCFSNIENDKRSAGIPSFEPWKSEELYRKFITILKAEYKGTKMDGLILQLEQFLTDLEKLHSTIKIPKTLVHNDFNPRNVAMRKKGNVCIYDWELAMYHFPQRDVVEFLSFVMPLNFDKELMLEYLNYHFELQSGKNSWAEWKAACDYAIKEFLITRVSFYLAGKIVMNYLFAERIFLNAFQMIDALKEEGRFVSVK